MKRLKAEHFLSLTAVVVSICALFISITEARLMKAQQKAMLYPHLDISPSYGANGFDISVKNSGAGIAMVKSVTVQDGDRYFSEWMDVINHYLPDTHQVGYNLIYVSDINKKAILPGEEIEVFRVPWNEETRILVDSLYNLKIRIDYCSLLDDCWEITNELDFPEPDRPVNHSTPDRCPDCASRAARSTAPECHVMFVLFSPTVFR